VEHAEAYEHDGQADYSEDFTHVALNIPAKPMNARDKLPAIMNISAVPLANSGISANSVFSRMDAMSTNAKVSPNPAPTANAIPCRNPYPLLVWKMANPSIAQFVVMSGR
jgi:hypothetical protein